MQRGPKPTLKRRRRRKQSSAAGPKMLAGVAVITIGILWTAGVLFFSFTLIDHTEQLETRKLFEDFPVGAVDLWPNDRTNKDVLDSLKSCDTKKCQEKLEPAATSNRIGVLRPPGVFGRIIEGVALEAIGLFATEETDMNLLPTSHIGLEHNYAKVIRAASLPILLEALDLALLTVDETFTVHDITQEDVLGVVRQLLRWHCRLDEVAGKTPLTTVTLSRAIPYPISTGKQILAFLSFENFDTDFEFPMDGFTEEVFLRIDECSALATLVNSNAEPPFTLEEETDRVIQEELEATTCQSTLYVRESRVTEIVGHLLDSNEESTSIICKEYPKIPVCFSGSTERHE